MRRTYLLWLTATLLILSFLTASFPERPVLASHPTSPASSHPLLLAEVRVSGTIQWYQGDPAIYVTAPEQMESR